MRLCEIILLAAVVVNAAPTSIKNHDSLSSNTQSLDSANEGLSLNPGNHGEYSHSLNARFPHPPPPRKKKIILPAENEQPIAQSDPPQVVPRNSQNKGRGNRAVKKAAATLTSTSSLDPREDPCATAIKEAQDNLERKQADLRNARWKLERVQSKWGDSTTDYMRRVLPISVMKFMDAEIQAAEQAVAEGEKAVLDAQEALFRIQQASN